MPATDVRDMLEAQGFDADHRWPAVALRERFERVPAVHLERCPNCDAAEASVFGEYVYYSHLAVLRRCEGCGLIWSDLRLGEDVLRRHFERAYKGDRYFEGRRRIFAQVAEEVARLAPRDGRVLDVGGAEGHLMRAVAVRRPDLHLVVNDLSRDACAVASRRFGLACLPGSIAEVARRGERFDVVVLCDVIYYEPDIGAVWELLRRCVSPGGAVILRVPNKAFVMEMGIRMRRWWPGRGIGSRMTLPFFNPEHIYVLTPGFLRGALERVGFRAVDVLPSPLFGGGRLADLVSGLLVAGGGLLPGDRVGTPSLCIVGRNGGG